MLQVTLIVLGQYFISVQCESGYYFILLLLYFPPVSGPCQNEKYCVIWEVLHSHSQIGGTSANPIPFAIAGFKNTKGFKCHSQLHPSPALLKPHPSCLNTLTCGGNFPLSSATLPAIVSHRRTASIFSLSPIKPLYMQLHSTHTLSDCPCFHAYFPGVLRS